MTEPVTPVRDDDAGCWQHGDAAIVERTEPAVRVIEHCSICGTDVGWTWQSEARSEALAQRDEEVARLRAALTAKSQAYHSAQHVGIGITGGTSWDRCSHATCEHDRLVLTERLPR